MHFPRSIRREPGHYAAGSAWFHVSVRVHPEVARFAPCVSEAIWTATLAEASTGRVIIAAVCLMPDHLHVLVQPRTTDLLRWLNAWKSITTRKAWACGHRGALWQPGMWDRAIRTSEEFAAVVAYIRANPVAAGLREESSEWPFLFVDEEWG